MIPLSKGSLINKVFYLLSLLLAAYIIFGPSPVLERKAKREEGKEGLIEEDCQAPLVNTSKINKGLFKPLVEEKKEQPVKKPEVISVKKEKKPSPKPVPPKKKPTLRELSRGFSLIGIILSEGNFQAVIQERGGGRTYFLKQEDSINGVKIKEISRDKVILSYEEEELELGM